MRELALYGAANGGGVVHYSPTQRRLGLIQMRPEYQQPKALADVRVRYAVAHGMDDQTRVDIFYRQLFSFQAFIDEAAGVETSFA